MVGQGCTLEIMDCCRPVIDIKNTVDKMRKHGP